MRTIIKAKIHLLAANKTPTSIFLDAGRELYLSTPDGLSASPRFVGQHLYFTTDEEIKEGGWRLYYNTGEIRKTTKEDLLLIKHYEEECKKIVATSNPEIQACFGNDGEGYRKMKEGVPKIDTTFIEAYIKAYNEGKPIIEVLLEQAEYINQFNQKGKTNTKYSALKLKSNSSVVVHPVKEKIYTREELKKAIWNFGCKLWIEEYGENPNEEKTNMTKIFNNWFDKKYPE